MPVTLSTLVAKLAVTSAAFALNPKLVVTSVAFTFNAKDVFTSDVFAFNAKLLFILVGSKALAAKSDGVTYILLLSTKFTLLFNAALIASAVNDVMLDAIISFTIFL